MLDSILITGGSRGIGEAAVRKFTAMGKRVAFTYKDSSERAKALSRDTGAYAIQADMADGDAIIRVVKEAHDAIGDIDVLVNNAGISKIKLFLDSTKADWEEMLSINVSGARYMTQAVLPDMIRNNIGRIINVSSVWGIHGASCEVDYSTAKAALIGFTKALTKELLFTGINVNCVAPGVIDTDMNSCFSESELNEIMEEIPMRRMGKPQEVAELICFLASDKARAINGQVITIDGGYAL